MPSLVTRISCSKRFVVWKRNRTQALWTTITCFHRCLKPFGQRRREAKKLLFYKITSRQNYSEPSSSRRSDFFHIRGFSEAWWQDIAGFKKNFHTIQKLCQGRKSRFWAAKKKSERFLNFAFKGKNDELSKLYLVKIVHRGLKVTT